MVEQRCTSRKLRSSVAESASAVQSVNSGDARPDSCGPVRRSASAVGTATRFVVGGKCKLRIC